MHVNSYPNEEFPALDFPLQEQDIPDYCVRCTITMLNRKQIPRQTLDPDHEQNLTVSHSNVHHSKQKLKNHPHFLHNPVDEQTK